jgi:hypothetical protein
MSEHDTGFEPARFEAYRAACAAASRYGALLVPGIEYSSPDNDIHILTWGVEHFLTEHRPVGETLSRVAEADGVAIFAHPARRAAWKSYDPDWTPLLHGIELWNRKADGIAWGREALDLIGLTGLPATVGHDFHRLRQLYPLWQGVQRPASGGDREAWGSVILDALRAGHTVPYAFGRPLLDADGRPGPALHRGLDVARRALRDMVKGVSGRGRG